MVRPGGGANVLRGQRRSTHGGRITPTAASEPVPHAAETPSRRNHVVVGATPAKEVGKEPTPTITLGRPSSRQPHRHRSAQWPPPNPGSAGDHGSGGAGGGVINPKTQATPTRPAG